MIYVFVRFMFLVWAPGQWRLVMCYRFPAFWRALSYWFVHVRVSVSTQKHLDCSPKSMYVVHPKTQRKIAHHREGSHSYSTTSPSQPHLAIVQHSFSAGFWPTFAKKVSLFSVSLCETFAEPVLTLGWVSIWIPTFEGLVCIYGIFGHLYGCYSKLLHDRMTSSWKTQIPLADAKP